jgi:hypothetical protein
MTHEKHTEAVLGFSFDPYVTASTVLNKNVKKDVGNAHGDTNAIIANAEIRRQHNRAAHFTHRTYDVISDEAKRDIAYGIAVDMAFEDLRIADFCTMRDHIRRKCKQYSYSIRVSDMMDIIDTILDEQAHIVMRFEEWAGDRDMMDRLRRISANSRGNLHAGDDSTLRRLTDRFTAKLRSIIPLLAAPQVPLPSSGF